MLPWWVNTPSVLGTRWEGNLDNDPPSLDFSEFLFALRIDAEQAFSTLLVSEALKEPRRNRKQHAISVRAALAVHTALTLIDDDCEWRRIEPAMQERLLRTPGDRHVRAVRHVAGQLVDAVVWATADTCGAFHPLRRGGCLKLLNDPLTVCQFTPSGRWLIMLADEREWYGLAPLPVRACAEGFSRRPEPALGWG